MLLIDFNNKQIIHILRLLWKFRHPGVGFCFVSCLRLTQWDLIVLCQELWKQECMNPIEVSLDGLLFRYYLLKFFSVYICRTQGPRRSGACTSCGQNHVRSWVADFQEGLPPEPFQHWGRNGHCITWFFLLYWKKTWHFRAQKFIKHWNICCCIDTISSLGIILEKARKSYSINQWWPVIVPFVNRQDDEWSPGSFLCPRPCRNKWDRRASKF